MSTIRTLSEREIVTLVAEDYPHKPVVKLPHKGIRRDLDYFSDSLETIPQELQERYLTYCHRRMYDLFIRQQNRVAEIEFGSVTLGTRRVERIVDHELIQSTRGHERFSYIVNQKWAARPRWIILEALLVEILKSNRKIIAQKNPNIKPLKENYTDKQLIDQAVQFGLHLQTLSGHHLQPADGLFAAFMEDLQIPAPPNVLVPNNDKKHNWWDRVHGRMQGSSTLVLYTAPNCTRHPICKIRIGKDDLNIGCFDCGSKFIPQI